MLGGSGITIREEDSSELGANNKSESFFVGGTLGVGEGGCGTSPELIVLGVKRTPGLDPVPSLEALEMTVDSSGTPSMLPVPSFEPPVPGYLLLIFLLSLRAFIMSAASCSAGVRV
ncbi:hypothetical protein Tco_1106334 [Tanacetum coccineum]